MSVSAPPPSWASIKNKPSTLAGFGITDGVTSVGSGNGLQGGPITSTGNLSVAAPGFNTVGSYCIGSISGNAFSIGSSYAASSISMYNGGIISAPISGTWMCMGSVYSGAGGTVNLVFVRTA